MRRFGFARRGRFGFIGGFGFAAAFSFLAAGFAADAVLAPFVAGDFAGFFFAARADAAVFVAGFLAGLDLVLAGAGALAALEAFFAVAFAPVEALARGLAAAFAFLAGFFLLVCRVKIISNSPGPPSANARLP